MAKVLLVGVDGSDAGRRALQFATGRARDLGATLVLVHVIPWSPYSFNTPEENEQRHERRQQELASAAPVRAGCVPGCSAACPRS